MQFLSNRVCNRKQRPLQQTPTHALAHLKKYGHLSFHEQTLYHFKVALLPYYMRSNDHFTMAIPLEHRFPLLDYRVVELSQKFPIPYLFKNGWTKYVLRKAMEPYLPKKILWRRKKMGFPFAYRRFLSRHCQTFEPLLENLNAIGFPIDEFGDYSKLISADPVLLWRLVSISIWWNDFRGMAS
jgi:asparagine synthase (glutamine-hydrolysing)